MDGKWGWPEDRQGVGLRRAGRPRASAGAPFFAQAGPRVRLVHLAYQAAGHELAARTLDYSPPSLLDRAA